MQTNNETLTDAERCFIDHFCHETLQLKQGVAIEWMIENGIIPLDLNPFIHARSDELKGMTAFPAKPMRFLIPWKNKDGLMTRANEIFANKG